MSACLFNDEPALTVSAHFPLNGAWSAEVQASSDTVPAVGARATLTLPGPIAYIGRVERAGLDGARLRVRMTGSTNEWSRLIDAKHYKQSDGDAAMRDLGVQTEAPLELDLPFWTRPAGTIGNAVQTLAGYAQVNWRVLSNGTTRIRAEAPFVVQPDATEIFRDDARGLVECAPEVSVIQPGTIVGDDQVGDVVYEHDGEVFRCRYWTQQRAGLRGSLERLVRWVMRDTVYLGQYACQVISQGADGTLDLLPEDPRIRADGLQSVPIRHGLPGVRVTVPPGVRVLVGFENGDARQPYASLWHEGAVLGIELGGKLPVAIAQLVDAALAAHVSQFNAHTHLFPAGIGAPVPTPPPTIPMTPDAPTAALILKTS